MTPARALSQAGQLKRLVSGAEAGEILAEDFRASALRGEEGEPAPVSAEDFPALLRTLAEQPETIHFKLEGEKRVPEPEYSIRAWRAVVTYLLRQQEFLYE